MRDKCAVSFCGSVIRCLSTWFIAVSLIASSSSGQTPTPKPLTAAQQAKIKKEFDAKDTNGDGKVSLAEEIASQQKEAAGKFTPTDFSSPPARKAGPGSKTVLEPTFTSWLEHNVEVRQTIYNQKDANNPAKFAWTRTAGEDAFYTVDGAVAITSFASPRDFIIGSQTIWASAAPAFEAHFSNQNNTHAVHKSQNSLAFALPITLAYSATLTEKELDDDWLNRRGVNVPGSGFRSSGWLNGGQILAVPTYRLDREAEIRALEMGLFWRPGTAPKVALNVSRPIIPDLVTFRWDPLLGIELGSYTDGKPQLAPGIPSDYARGIIRLHAELNFGARLALIGDYTRRLELFDGSPDRHYYELSLAYKLDEERVVQKVDAAGNPKFDPETGKPENVLVPGHFTIGASWKKGRDVPAFDEVDTYSAWLGVQF